MGDTCILCGSERYEILSTKLRHDRPGSVVRCGGCGLGRLLGAQGYAEKLNDFYVEQYAQEYYSGVKAQLDSLFDSFLPVQAHRVENMSPYLDHSHRVLEIGSGPGYFLASIRDRVAEIQGVELNRREACYAREVRGIPTSDRPHESGNLPRGYYDNICLFQVLEHTADPVKFLAGLKHFLREGGRIHIEIPNLMDPLVWFYDVEPYRNFYYQEPHLYYFTPETLGKVCEAAGFKTAKIFGFQQTSLVNNLNWVFLGKPQASRWDCIQPTLPPRSLREDVSVRVRDEFAKLLTEFNRRYIHFMERSGYTDMVFATIDI